MIKINPSSEVFQSVHVTAAHSPADECFLPPTLFVFNAAALSEPHAIEQLDAELRSLNVDVAVINETHLKQKHPDLSFSIAGYKLHRKDRKRRKGGGVAVYARTDLWSVDFSSPAAAISEDYELLWVRLTSQGTIIVVGALYHSPETQSYKEEDLVACIVDSVDEIMTAIPSALTILAGDLNQLSDKVIAERTCLESIVIQPTRGTAFLDRVYVSMPCYDNVQVITFIIKSDHKAILASSSENKLLGKKQSWTAKYRKMGPSQNSWLMSTVLYRRNLMDSMSL